MSRYQNAAEVLPPELLRELQRYAGGRQLYVPRPSGRLGWGERSGAREALAHRNDEIRRRARQGATIDELMAEFHLGCESIRKILARSGGGSARASAGKNGSSRSGR